MGLCRFRGLLLISGVIVGAIISAIKYSRYCPPENRADATRHRGALPLQVKGIDTANREIVRGEIADLSSAIAIVCGMDEATADRYEARNDALRSITRRRDLPKDDVEALLAYLRSQDDSMRVETLALNPVNHVNPV